MKLNSYCRWLALVLVFSLTQTAQAHFPWLEVTENENGKPTLTCYFSESPTPDDPSFLQYVADADVYRLPRRGEPTQLEAKKTEESLTYPIEAGQSESVFALDHVLGVMDRGDSKFLVHYYSTTGPSPNSWAWRAADSLGEVQNLTIVPELDQNELTVAVKFQGKPAADAEVYFVHDLVEMEPVKTDKNGRATIDISEQSIQGARVKYVQEKSGTHEDKEYKEARHYNTLTFPSISYNKLQVKTPYPALPESVTSFGAAVANGTLYTYGGHTGGAHSYSTKEQANTLWALELKEGAEWKSLGEGPHLQGLALVAHDGNLYRIGGFTAKNDEGEDHDLWSQSTFARFNPKTGKWKELPSLPERRSSFDAAVMNNKIFVIGGWSMEGEADNQWHQTAWSYDLSEKDAEWTRLPSPPFQKRALSVAAYNGKIYAIGGMTQDGPTTAVSIYDPETSSWSEGPSINGHSMSGFGTSSFALDGKLFVSTYDGTLQVLADDGKSWKNLGNLENARFFHRMIPADEKNLLLVGGSNMSIGKFDEIDVIDVTTLSE